MSLQFPNKISIISTGNQPQPPQQQDTDKEGRQEVEEFTPDINQTTGELIKSHPQEAKQGNAEQIHDQMKGRRGKTIVPREWPGEPTQKNLPAPNPLLLHYTLHLLKKSTQPTPRNVATHFPATIKLLNTHDP